MRQERYFLDRDSSGHWYLVPVDNRRQWIAWSNLDEDDERAWTTPAYAKRLMGSPFNVTFTDPKE